MKACIHRGARQIGGTCIEVVESSGARLILDVGTPLDTDAGSAELPSTLGQNVDVAGVVVSHPHTDHYGLVGSLPAEAPILIGESAQAILEAAGDFIPSRASFANTIALQDRKTVELGAFRITPYLMDHSAYDSYAILVEADGNSLFYTGDLRAQAQDSWVTGQSSNSATACRLH